MSLSIATYNMQGFRAATIPYLAYLLSLFDIVFVQEHWLFESQFHFFNDKFPDTSSRCISAMDSIQLSLRTRFRGMRDHLEVRAGLQSVASAAASHTCVRGQGFLKRNINVSLLSISPM
jgi:hypothetical protein